MFGWYLTNLYLFPQVGHYCKWLEFKLSHVIYDKVELTSVSDMIHLYTYRSISALTEAKKFKILELKYMHILLKLINQTQNNEHSRPIVNFRKPANNENYILINCSMHFTKFNYKTMYRKFHKLLFFPFQYINDT